MNSKLLMLSILCCAFVFSACGNMQPQSENIPTSGQPEIIVTPENASEIGFQAKDYINAPGPFLREGQEYQLTWSLPSQNGYHIQEYITPDQNIEQFHEMFIVSAQAHSELTAQFALNGLITSLQQVKDSGEDVEYNLIECPDATERVLEFEMGDRDFTERNIYRYKTIESNGETTGVARFSLSKRDYKKSRDFWEGKENEKSDTIDEFCQIAYPNIIL